MTSFSKEEIKFLVAFITPIVSFIIGFYLLQAEVNYQKERINNLEVQNKELIKKIETMDIKFTEIQVSLAQIQKDISFMKERIR
jgi:hypothetical protein